MKRSLLSMLEHLKSLKLEQESQSVENYLSEFNDAIREDPGETLRSGNALLKSLSAATQYQPPTIVDRQSNFFPLVVNVLLHLLDEEAYENVVCSIVELLTELLTQITTRRYLLLYLKDRQILPRLHLSRMYVENSLFWSLTESLSYYESFAVDEVSGEALSEEEASEQYYKKMLVFQNVVYKYVNGMILSVDIIMRCWRMCVSLQFIISPHVRIFSITFIVFL